MDRQFTNAGPKRCLVVSSRIKYDQYAEEDRHFIEKAIKFASWDYSKAFHLLTRKTWRRVYIVFDYDNPNHDDCDVVAFEIKRKTRYANLTADMTANVHKYARYSIDCGCPFPMRTELKPNPDLLDPADLSSLRSPTNATTNAPKLLNTRDTIPSKQPNIVDKEEEEEELPTLDLM
ncbi:hypothetical protein MKZ38_008982 [Zalerion maritima]|uniref:Uncharacterized protein n=1 Tax=Zalerion maritima TaxID=339359 RepID=A0AAD5RGR0_9PEZI|nr:hypothetical protein MKZ38_008982 [Zalerion maritima]